MGATGYIIKEHGGSIAPQKEVEVTPADGTIDVERVESGDVVNFRIKTAYDGYETINCGSGYASGYFKAIHVKFNDENRRYRLVCILNGGSYTPVAEDFAIYYIKFGWRTGGANADHWYIQEYSRRGNGSFVALEQIALNEYNILIHTPSSWSYANIGILKEDKEDNVTIEHFNGASTSYTPTGTIITTDTPVWKNGALVETNTEDLTTKNGLLQFNDRSTNNGLGYVILRTDKSFAEQVVQTNTIYEVRYNFDLGGTAVTIPAGCILMFDGGRISNGTLNGNDTTISASIVRIFGDNLTIDGTWHNSFSYPEWYGENGLFNQISQLEKLSNVVKLTKPEYINNSATTLHISKHLISSINTQLTFNNATEGFIAVQLGEISTSPSNRTKGVILDGVNIYVSKVQSGVTKTACIGIGTITKSTIRNSQFKNANLKTSEFTETELESPSDYCNYAIIINGNSDTTSFHNTITTADISIYLATHTDFISWYDADFMGSNFSYAAVCGEASDKLNFYGCAFAKCGIRGFDLHWEGDNVCASVMLNGCRFEQPRSYSGENALWRMIKVASNPAQNTTAMHFELNECMFCKGTIFEGSVSKGALCLNVNGGGYIQSYEDIQPFLLNVTGTSILNIKFTGAHWVENCSTWIFDNNFQYEGISYKLFNGYRMLDLSNCHIYKNYGGAPSLAALPTSSNIDNVDQQKGASYFNTKSTINKPLWWDGSSWIDATGNNPELLNKGTTAQRPTLSSNNAGFQYFDIDLGKPIYWTGSKWVDATGNDLQ